MRARWYDPATGQFTTSDPIGFASGETNLYRYAAGDPANLTDPTGTSIWDAIAGLDNPVSQAVAGALNGAFSNAPAKAFGFDPGCAGGAFDFGSTYLSVAVPFPGGKLAAAGKLAGRAGGKGIYVIKGANETYVGQSGRIPGRLAQHVGSGRFTQAEVDAAERVRVSGGRTAREIAEQLKIDELGGIDALGNARNPIGPNRLGLMPAGYARP